MAFEKKVALAGSLRGTVTGATAARPVDKNEMVHATVVLVRAARSKMPETTEQFGFSSPGAVNHHNHGEALERIQVVVDRLHQRAERFLNSRALLRVDAPCAHGVGKRHHRERVWLSGA